MNIIFMGTPNFAIPVFEKLIKSKHRLLGVYTRRPKKANRGQQLQTTPIHKIAEKNNLKIFTPLNLRNEKEQQILKALQPDLIIVVAYGLIIPEAVLNIPKYGCLNIHPSLLPRWRGSAPIERCLLSEDTETGVCIMKLDAGMDTGDVIKMKKITITSEMTIDYLHNNLALMGAEMLIEVVDEIEKTNGNITTYKQDDNLATLAPKIEKEEGKINFVNSINYIDRQIRTFGKTTGAYIIHNNNRIKIIQANFEKQDKIQNEIGFVYKDFSFQCKDGLLKPLILQKEGKKPVEIKDFLNGYKF